MLKYFVFVALILYLFCGMSTGKIMCNIQSSTSRIFKDTVKKDTLKIDTVGISKVLTAEEKYSKKKRDHRTIYMWGDNKKPFSLRPYGGLLININKVYSHFSKIGKQSRRLQRVFDNELEQDLAEQMWHPLTIKLTPLKGDSLFAFQNYFQPSSLWLKESSYYEKVAYIQQSMRIYRDSTDYIIQKIRLPKIEQK